MTDEERKIDWEVDTLTVYEPYKEGQYWYIDAKQENELLLKMYPELNDFRKGPFISEKAAKNFSRDWHIIVKGNKEHQEDTMRHMIRSRGNV